MPHGIPIYPEHANNAAARYRNFSTEFSVTKIVFSDSRVCNAGGRTSVRVIDFYSFFFIEIYFYCITTALLNKNLRNFFFKLSYRNLIDVITKIRFIIFLFIIVLCFGFSVMTLKIYIALNKEFELK